MVRSNQAARRPAANAAYHTLAGWGEEGEDEEEGSGERDGRKKRDGEKNKAKAGTGGRRTERKEEFKFCARKKKKTRFFLVATLKHFLVGGDEAEKSETLG